MKWYDVQEKLPPTYKRVMVCREIRIQGFAPIPTYDIGILKGTNQSDRWELDSQQYSPLPLKPTLSSGIVTHWARLPKLPNRKENKAMKKVDRDPFSNGTEHMRFEEYNCDKCIKHSHLKKEGDTHWEDEYTRIVCSIERDIFTRMGCNEPINERTIKVCDDFTLHGILCPYLKTKRKKYPRKYKNQTTLEL